MYKMHFFYEYSLRRKIPKWILSCQNALKLLFTKEILLIPWNTYTVNIEYIEHLPYRRT